MQTSTRALLSLVILVFLIPSGLLADEDSLFSIQDNAVVGIDVTERFLASHHVNKFTIVTIDTNRLREEIRTVSLLPNTGDARPLKFDLFEDLSFTLRPTLVQDVHVDGRTGLASWAGQLEPEADTFASVALHLNANNEVEGNFRTHLGRIRVEATEELPYHIVWLQNFEAKLDESKLFKPPRESESNVSSNASERTSPSLFRDVDEAQ